MLMWIRGIRISLFFYKRMGMGNDVSVRQNMNMPVNSGIEQQPYHCREQYQNQAV